MMKKCKLKECLNNVKSEKHQFCSVSCSTKFNNHKRSKNKDWKSTDYKKLDFCERCKSDKFLMVHHKNEDRQDNLLENLETICRKCHQKHHKVHRNFDEAYKTEKRNKHGRFGSNKPLKQKIICDRCNKSIFRINPRQKRCVPTCQ